MLIVPQAGSIPARIPKRSESNPLNAVDVGVLISSCAHWRNSQRLATELKSTVAKEKGKSHCQFESAGRSQGRSLSRGD